MPFRSLSTLSRSDARIQTALFVILLLYPEPLPGESFPLVVSATGGDTPTSAAGDASTAAGDASASAGMPAAGRRTATGIASASTAGVPAARRAAAGIAAVRASSAPAVGHDDSP